MIAIICSLFVLFQQVNAAGFLDIHLKSSTDQRATVTLSNENDPAYLVLPIILKKDEEMKFEDLFIDFNTTYKVGIQLDETESLGLSKSLFKGEITPIRGTSSPKTVNRPLTGIRFEFKCEENYSGEKCDILCEANKECSSEKTSENDVTLDVDYTVNPLKMQTIINMLKKENEVPNSFTTEKEEELLNQIMESSGEKP
ncbi:unnamed protein product [Caenorhabditis brenneri]